MAPFFYSNGEGGWGFVIRDDQGAVIRAGAGKQDHLLLAFHSELLGCAAGLKRAAEMGIARVVLETDANLVKAAVDGDDYRLSAMSCLITEIKLLASQKFTSCIISVCPRSCNRVAHELAVFGCNLPSSAQNHLG
jgi:hypothetical protein